MLETSARLLKLLSLLQTTRDWTGTELADRLEVTTRTVRNDVERLRDLGYPVHATRGAIGGYRLGAGAALPPLLLDDEEAVAVAVGLRSGASRLGRRHRGVVAAGTVQTGTGAAVAAAPPAQRAATYTVAVPPMGRVGPQVSTDVLTAIVAACRDRERLRFDYRAHDGAPSRRDVEPYRWSTGAGAGIWWPGTCERADWRTYRVDRIEPRTPTGPRFTPRPLPAEDLARYVARGVGTATWRYRARVTVFAPADEVADRLPIRWSRSSRSTSTAARC